MHIVCQLAESEVWQLLVVHSKIKRQLHNKMF